VTRIDWTLLFFAASVLIACIVAVCGCTRQNAVVENPPKFDVQNTTVYITFASRSGPSYRKFHGDLLQLSNMGVCVRIRFEDEAYPYEYVHVGAP
jgi:hypothetical protein